VFSDPIQSLCYFKVSLNSTQTGMPIPVAVVQDASKIVTHAQFRKLKLDFYFPSSLLETIFAIQDSE
jgi:hypothetical protein